MAKFEDSIVFQKNIATLSEAAYIDDGIFHDYAARTNTQTAKRIANSKSKGINVLTSHMLPSPLQ